jgi:hypothetical protein
MTRVRAIAGFLVGATLVAAACDDPLDVDAQIPVRTDTMTVFAMTGTPVTHPNTLDIFNFITTRLETGAQFDLVFDIDEQGNTVLYPAPLITSAPYRIGLRDTAAAFETVLRAPTGEYEVEEPLVLEPGRTAIIEAQHPQCQFTVSPFIYAKLVVDSIDIGTRKIFFRLTADRNCGYRSFEEGIPRN